MTAGQGTEIRKRQRQIACLLNSLRPIFEETGYQGAKVINYCGISNTRLAHLFRLPSIEPIRAWHIDSTYRRSRYLSAHGAMYTLIGYDSGERDKIHESIPLDEVKDEEFLQRGITYLGRLARAVAPSSIPAREFEMFGQIIRGIPLGTTQEIAGSLEFEKRYLPHNQAVIIPRMTYREPNESGSNPPTMLSPEDAYRAEQEFRCEDPSAGASMQPPRPESSLGTREQQIRYIFLSWLHLITVTGWNDPNAHPTAFFQPEAPYARGGPVTEAEVLRLVSQLVDNRLAKCVDPFSDRNPPWHLMLTKRGVKEAEELHGRYASPERTRNILRALLGWIGQYAKEPLTIGLSLFLSSVDCEISGMMASATEVYRAARWLANRGYLNLTTISLPTTHAMASVTREGVKCLDLHEGDVTTMQEAQRKAGDQKTYNFGSTRDVVIDSHHFQQFGGDVTWTSVDIDSLVRLAQAVSIALPALQLEPPRQRAAQSAASEIVTLADTGKPDHSKLDALGRSLRTILEGATSSVVAAALLKAWGG